MISEVDIRDWDHLSQEAYNEWADKYYEGKPPTTSGRPSQYAAFMAGMDWTIALMGKLKPNEGAK